MLERVKSAYEEYAFHKIYRAVYDFATVDLSAFYFDILKDRLYTAPAASPRRRAAQSTLYRIADALIRAIAPLMCFTAEEVWSQLPPSAEGGRREPSIHLATFVPPERLREGIPDGHLNSLGNWPQLIAVRNEVLKALEAARQSKYIGGALEAKVVLSATGELGALLRDYQAFLPALFIVSQVELALGPLPDSSSTELLDLRVRVEKAAGRKCERCWNYSQRVGEDARYPTVCERCSAALGEIARSA